MLSYETAVNIKGIIEDIYKKYGCNNVEVSAVYRKWNGADCRITERQDVRPARVNVSNDGTGFILINSEEPYLGERFFSLLDEIKKALRENKYSITQEGVLYDFFVVEFTYNN